MHTASSQRVRLDNIGNRANLQQAEINQQRTEIDQLRVQVNGGK